jgi:predicted negative regulator of RcsB-dependent stress response
MKDTIILIITGLILAVLFAVAWLRWDDVRRLL